MTRLKSQQALERQAEEFRRRLDALRDSVNIKGNASSALEEVVNAKENAARRTKQQMRELQERIDGLASIRSEIETEIDTLGLNEESRRVFESFEDICPKPKLWAVPR